MEYYFSILPVDLTNVVASFVHNYSDLENLIVSFPYLRSLQWPLIYFYSFGGEYIPNMTYERYTRILGINLLREKLNLNMSIVQLENLQNLNLSDNKLTDVPKEIGNLHNLQILYLYNNKLMHVPKEIGNLQNLQLLHLSNNQLTNVPKEIGNLQNLKYIYLHNNQLTDVPEEIGNLKNLQRLDLYNNQLTYVPKEILNLKNLDLRI